MLVVGHVPRLTEVVAGRRDGLRFDVDVMVGADGQTGAGWSQ